MQSKHCLLYQELHPEGNAAMVKIPGPEGITIPKSEFIEAASVVTTTEYFNKSASQSNVIDDTTGLASKEKGSIFEAVHPGTESSNEYFKKYSPGSALPVFTTFPAMIGQVESSLMEHPGLKLRVLQKLPHKGGLLHLK